MEYLLTNKDLIYENSKFILYIGEFIKKKWNKSYLSTLDIDMWKDSIHFIAFLELDKKS